MSIKVGFQGAHYTFSHIAVMEFFKGVDIEEINYKDFPTIIKAVEDGEIDYAMLPVENTTTGIISRTYDFFKDHNLFAVGELNVPIIQSLIVYPGTKVEDIREVYSHPEALSQCNTFFYEHPYAKAVPYQDTAKGVEHCAQCKDPKIAALGSTAAAKYYGMEVLIKEAQDSSTNVTRFLCVTNHQEVSENANKISSYFVVKHEPGSLVRTLSILAFRGINLLKLESRPIIGKNFEYCFYMDFDGNINTPEIKQTIEEAKFFCEEFKILGNYPKAK